MVYKISFEADVQGLASVKRVTGDIMVYGKDSSTVKHFAEGFLLGCYGEQYAILEIVPIMVWNLGA